jgi:endonuclease/exonuclease/phosphatase family metal-dependent hydrolase
MNDILTGSFARWRLQLWPPQGIRVVNWNIDRGLHLPQIADFLESQQADLLTLQEADLNAKRTHRRNVAEELARALGMNYVFGYEFQELNQGSRTSPAYHGQATLSRWDLKNSRVIRFQDQSNFWRPRWFLPHTEPFQERLGGRIALVTEVDVMGQAIVVYNLHLESRGEDNLRISQLKEVLGDTAGYKSRLPVVIAGDLNFDISGGQAPLLIEKAGMRNIFEQSRSPTTPARGLLGGGGRSIDWALVSRSIESSSEKVHANVSASDHYPISFSLRFA